jgi:hypothetical protein
MAPFKKSTANSLDCARTTLEQLNAKLGDLARAREARLLAGDPASEIAKIDKQAA